MPDTCYGVPPVAPLAASSRPAPVAPSRGAGTSDAPGGHAAANAEPPPMYWYPSFSSSFGQSIVDVVGRSRKSDALSILKAFDDSTRQAQDFMQKAVEYTSRANELMAKAHHECFTSMQKLLVDAHADKASFNKARRRARPRSEEPEAGGVQSDDDSAADDDYPETSDGRDHPLDEIPLEREDPEDEVPESPPEDSYHSSPAPSHGNDEAEDRDIMHDVDNTCDMFYSSLLIAPDALVRINATVIYFFLLTHHFLSLFSSMHPARTPHN